MVLSLSEFIGHFHPLLVHLPIGILLTGLLLLWMTRKGKNKMLREAVPVVFMFGVFAAILSCITGLLLSGSDDYDKNLAGWHQWMGISVAVLSSLLFIKVRNPQFRINENMLSFGLLILIFITGHLGGSLTHGSDYLTKPLSGIFSKDTFSNSVIRPIPNVREALVYGDVVKPILQTKCYSCHGENKQKGKLRLDDSVMIMKGGKDGKVIEPGNADESELIKRLLLPVDNEDHMPPKEKAQPSESQIALLHWWIGQGADFTKKVKDVNQSEKISRMLFALQKENVTEKESMDIPTAKVSVADISVMEKLRQHGVVVMPVSQNSNYVKANFVGNRLVNIEDLQLLPALKKQLIWLKLGFTNISDSNMAVISQLDNLTWLNLQHTNISDQGLTAIRSLRNLQYLNLVDTKVTMRGILQLKELKSLRSLYIYQVNDSGADWPALKNAFPKTRIDTGGYLVTLLPTDTVVLKAKKEY